LQLLDVVERTLVDDLRTFYDGEQIV